MLADLEVAQAAQRRLEDRVENLEGVIRDWGYDDEAEWWAEEPATHRAEASGGPRSGNTMCDQASTGTAHHGLDRDDGLSCVGTDAVGDITAVAATVA